jgi:hypothetical protein
MFTGYKVLGTATGNASDTGGRSKLMITVDSLTDFLLRIIPKEMIIIETEALN